MQTWQFLTLVALFIGLVGLGFFKNLNKKSE